MRFTPKTTEELEKEKFFLSPGEAQFEILTASEETSKKMNQMFKLQLKIWDCDGREGQLYDYVVLNTHGKLVQLLLSVGMMDKYMSGEVLPEDLINRSGRAMIHIQKDKEGKYPDKPAIKEYLAPESGRKEPPDFDKDSDVPF